VSGGIEDEDEDEDEDENEQEEETRPSKERALWSWGSVFSGAMR